MAAGEKTSFFYCGEDTQIGYNGNSISLLDKPNSSWADFKITHDIGKVWTKNGYLHLFRDGQARNRQVLLQPLDLQNNQTHECLAQISIYNDQFKIYDVKGDELVKDKIEKI